MKCPAAFLTGGGKGVVLAEDLSVAQQNKSEVFMHVGVLTISLNQHILVITREEKGSKKKIINCIVTLANTN